MTSSVSNANIIHQSIKIEKDDTQVVVNGHAWNLYFPHLKTNLGYKSSSPTPLNSPMPLNSPTAKKVDEVTQTVIKKD